MTTMLTTDRLLATEHEGWTALCEGRGAEFYADLMTETGLMVLANGQVLDRVEVIESLSSAPSWDGYEIVEPRFLGVGDGAAALVYRAQAHRGDEEPFVALMSSVYNVVEGRLRLALYQQTPATEATRG